MTTGYTFTKGISPIVATAIHDGHDTRAEVCSLFHLNEDERLREEDPYTANWVKFSDNRIMVNHSRFETDVNRPRDKAVYRVPGDCWGLKVWKDDLSEEIYKGSLSVYDNFYQMAKEYFDSLFLRHEQIIVYDIHSYNHQRKAENTFDDPQENPEVNIGTKNLDHDIWRPAIDAMINNFRSFDYNGRHLDVRENIKFKGGHFGQWLYEQYGKKICPISIEFKKFFMNEWTGQPFEEDIELIHELLKQSKESVLHTLKDLNGLS